MTQVMRVGAGLGGGGRGVRGRGRSHHYLYSQQQQEPQKGPPESGNSCFPANIKVCIIKSRTVQRLFARHEQISGFNATGQLPAVCHVENAASLHRTSSV